MLRKMVTALVCAALATSGCASAGGQRIPQAAPGVPVQDTAMLADYVQRLPAGSRVRVERLGGEVLRGTLMRATADSIVVQKNTRVPEKPVEIALSDLTRVTLETGSSSTGKTFGIGMAAGAAATMGVLLVLALMFAGG